MCFYKDKQIYIKLANRAGACVLLGHLTDGRFVAISSLHGSSERSTTISWPKVISPNRRSSLSKMHSSQTHTLHTESQYSHAIIYHTCRQIIQTEKKNLKGTTIQSSLSSLSLLSWLKRLSLIQIHSSHSHSQDSAVLISHAIRFYAVTVVVLHLVLPLGLLGDHLLHAERGKTDAEGGQQCRGPDCVPIGGFARVTGSGTGELIHLSIV